MVLPAYDTSSDASTGNVDRSHRFHSLVLTATSLLSEAANLGESNAPPSPPAPPASIPPPSPSPPPTAGEEAARDPLRPPTPRSPLAAIIERCLVGADADAGAGAGGRGGGFVGDEAERLGVTPAGSANRIRGSGTSIWESEISSSFRG